MDYSAGGDLPGEVIVRPFMKKFRRKLSKLIGENRFPNYRLISFRNQPAMDVNYFLKIHIGDERFIHVRVRLSIEGNVTLVAVQLDKKSTDKIFYFDLSPGHQLAFKQVNNTKQLASMKSALQSGQMSLEAALPRLLVLLQQNVELKQHDRHNTKIPLSDEERVPNEIVRKIMETIRPELESEIGTIFTDYTVIAFRSQLVYEGVDYFIKMKIGNQWAQLCAHRSKSTNAAKNTKNVIFKSFSSAIEMINIDVLPDVPFLVIFSHLSASDLLVVDQVCSRWSRLARSVGDKRTKLTILIGSNTERTIKEGSCFKIAYLDQVSDAPETFQLNPVTCYLKYDWLNTETVKMIEEVFPRLSSLELMVRDVNMFRSSGKICHRESIMNPIARLLDFYAGMLVDLKVMTLMMHDQMNVSRVRFQNEFNRLCPSLNRMTKLKRLTWIIANSLHGNPNEESHFNHSFLNRLESLNIDARFDNDPAIKMLHMLSPDWPGQIRLTIASEQTRLLPLRFQHPRQCRSIVHLPDMSFSISDGITLNWLVTELDCLQSIRIGNIDQLRQIRHLTPLTQLKHLINLRLDLEKYPIGIHKDALSPTEEAILPTRIPVLSRVKLLTLFICFPSLAQLQQEMNWHCLVPNVEVIHFQMIEGQFARYRQIRPDDIKVWMHDSRLQAAEFFNSLPSLNRIYFDGYRGLDDSSAKNFSLFRAEIDNVNEAK